jgi:predicted phosphodiesterase
MGAMNRPQRLITFLRHNRVPLVKGGLRLLLVLLLIAVVIQIFAPATYRLSEGRVTFQLAPSWPGGKVIMPLGPAGVLQLDTHRMPMNLKLDFTLKDSVPSVSEAQALLGGLPELRSDAVAAFYSFLESRVPWILLLGALAGALIAGGGRRWLRGTLLHALYGVGVVTLLAVAFVGATLLTFDSTPSVRYEGLARNLPRVVELVRQVNADSGAAESGISDFVRGIQNVAAQLDTAAHGPTSDVTRVLAVSDVHDNVIGMLLAKSLVEDKQDPFSLILMAGDLTVRGTKPEAQLFLREFSGNGLPVLMVGGNHEDGPAMKAFESAGYHVLDNRSESGVGGLSVFGVTDPMAWSLDATPDEKLLQEGGAAALDRFRLLDPPPNVFLVHDLREAQAIVDYAKAEALPLTVVYGHDHVASVKTDGSVTLVDVGTSGASGYLTLGQEGSPPYTFQILDFSREAKPRLLSVTTMAYEGLYGKATATYTPIAR